MQISSASPLSLATVDVCIFGDGAVAMTAVLLARQQGLSVAHIKPFSPESAVVRSQPLSLAVPRTYAIAPGVQAGLKVLGVWQQLKNSNTQVCQQMRVTWQSDSQDFPITLDAQSAGVAQLCSFVSEADLISALGTATSTANSGAPHTIYTDPEDPHIERLANGDVSIHLPNQAPISAKLCIVAQGASSPIAAQLGLAPTVYDYQHSAVVAVLHADSSTLPVSGAARPNDIAWQWLGGAAQGHDVLALLPLPPTADCKHRYGLVWSQPTAQAAHWLKTALNHPEQLLAAIQARCGQSIGELSLHSAVQQFPLFRAHTKTLYAGNTVLIGDSAHKIHPLAGQGLNLGFEDAFALFEVIARKEPWRELRDSRLLARYQRQRNAAMAGVENAIHAIARRGAWVNQLRTPINFGVRTMAQFPKLHSLAKNRIIKLMGE